LLPRLKAIHSQKLYRPETGKADAYASLQQVLTRPIDWELVRQQYDQMIKYATAVRLGTAETEAILRRFTKKNVQHPTYKAFAELGKAIKTIFLCRYLHSEELRREINEGLNVVEQWNGATDFVFFARRGEMTSNQRGDHEISMLALHLIQNCMVYVNTLMIQTVLTQPQWQGKLTPRDYAALTPLIWEHVNPYGRFVLEMIARLALLCSNWRLVSRLLVLPLIAGTMPWWKVSSLHSRVSRCEEPASPPASRPVFHYIEVFDKSKRLHSYLGYRSPASFEAKYQETSMSLRDCPPRRGKCVVARKNVKAMKA
jgi:hypothetical protein